MPYRDVSISRTDGDAEKSAPLAEALQARGITLESDLQRASALLLLVTPAAFDSVRVNDELRVFGTFMAQDPSRLLIPVKLEPCELAPWMAARWWVDATTLPLDQVVEALAGVLTIVAPPAVAMPMPSPASQPLYPPQQYLQPGYPPTDYSQPTGYPQRSIQQKAIGQPAPATYPVSQTLLPLLAPPTTSPIKVSRRAFLVAGAAGFAAFSVGGVLASCAPASSGKPPLLRPIPTPLAPFVYRGHSDRVYAVTWSPDGTRIASAGADRTVQVWDAADGSHVYTYRGHSDIVNSVAWSPDGTRIASASQGTVHVWDASDGGYIIGHVGGFNGNDTSDIAWSPTGKWIVSAEIGGIRVWSANDGSILSTYSESPDFPGTGLAAAWSPDGKRVASSNLEESGDVFVWNVTNASQFYVFHTHWDLQDLVLSIAWSPDGKRLACAGGMDRTFENSAHIWDATNGERISGYSGPLGGVADISWSPDSKRIAAAGNDATAQVWDVATGGSSSVFIYRGHSGPVTSVAWSPSGQNIASGSEDHTVQVWEPH